MNLPGKHFLFVLFLLLSGSTAFAQCRYAWAVWTDQGTTQSATARLTVNGQTINMNMQANYPFTFTPDIWNYAAFSAVADKPANTTACRTTWSAGPGGQTTMCFDRQVENPVLLLSSIGSPNKKVDLSFSVPYTVLFDGGGNTFTDPLTISGQEGYCIIEFPGMFNCVTIFSTTPEDYTNLTWGIKNPLKGGFTYTDNCGNVSFLSTATINPPGAIIATEWKFGDGATANGTSVNHQYAANGTYTVEQTITSDNLCKNTFTQVITVNSYIVTQHSQTICPGKSYVINGNSYTTAGVYHDTFPSFTTGCDSVVITTLSLFPDLSTNLGKVLRCAQDGYTLPDGRWTDTSGIYSIMFTSPDGCTYTNTVDLQITPAIKILISKTPVSCYGLKDGSVTLSPDPSNTSSLPLVYTMAGRTNRTGTFGNLEAGVYTYWITDEHTCRISGDIKVEQPDKVIADISPNDVMVPTGTKVHLKASSNYADATFLWHPPLPSSVCDTCREIGFEAFENEKYRVTVSVVINGNICTGEADAEVRVLPTLFAPTAFTPNGDGTNDYFSAPGISTGNLKEFEVMIYNRWGALVFRSESPGFKWDGTSNGVLAPQGVYTYIIRYRIANKSTAEPEIKRNLTLMR